VSVAAASSVLGAAPSTIGVSAETRRRILRVAADLGYRRNPLAASFRTGRTYDIGICMADAHAHLTHPEGAFRFWAICDAAARCGYRVSLVGLRADQHMDPRLLDGCVAMGGLGDDLRAAMERFSAAIPVLTLGPPIPNAIPVREDVSWMGERARAARYLFGLGHRVIAVSYLKHAGRVGEVHELFRAVARQEGIDATIYGLGELTLTREYASLEALWSLKPFPTALYAVDDEYARAAISRLAERGLRVPEDLSVFSGNTHSERGPLTPALTGLDIHTERIIEELIRKFVGIVESRERPKELTLGPVRVELLERDSCAKAPSPPAGASRRGGKRLSRETERA